MMPEHNTLVAVYGSLREGHGNHRMLEGYKNLSTEWSVPEFIMHSLGGFPAIIAGNSMILMELYLVNDETFARLDMLEGYPHMYNRRQITTSKGLAWIYYMEDLHTNHWRSDTVVDSGDWTQFRSNTQGWHRATV